MQISDGFFKGFRRTWYFFFYDISIQTNLLGKDN